MQVRTMLARFAFWIALAFTLLMALSPHPPRVLPFNVWDKVQHAAAFGVLAGLAAFGYPRSPLVRLGEHLSFVGALIEVLQAMPMIHRDCDIRDWIADTIAITVALGLVRWLRSWPALRDS